MSNLEKGFAAQKAGDRKTAEDHYLRAIALGQEPSKARLLLGTLYAQLGREREAADVLRMVVADEPANFAALSWLAGVLGTLQEFEEAGRMANRALRIRPNDINVMLHFATAEFGLENYESAAKAFIRVIKLAPRSVSAYCGLASTFLKLGEPMKARLAMLDARHLSNDDETLMKLAEVCLTCELPDEVLEATGRILARNPKNAEALFLQVRANRIALREADEDAAIRKLVEFAPEDSRTHLHRGRRLQGTGNFVEAETEFLKAIELNPKQGLAYYGVVSGRKVKPSDLPMVEAMEALLADQELSDDDRAHLEYGLGKAYDDLDNYGEAMKHFDEGNRLVRSLRAWTQRFDREAMRTRYRQLQAIFSKQELSRVRAASDRSVEPIIVAGFMRSGTTLMEQILSRHPEIGAGGEQQFWLNTLNECVDYAQGAYNAEKLEASAQAYCKLLAELAPGKRKITDKNPANYTCYGLINIAFPNTRIIHMRRNPVDVAISTYTTMMRTGAPFVGDKDDIVFALKTQAELTRHWLEVLPQDRFMIVTYEDLTREPEPVIRKVVEFLGLPWSDACLTPESSKRTVSTPSLWQVRQPVYTTSVDRWRRYEPWLGPFEELIESK